MKLSSPGPAVVAAALALSLAVGGVGYAAGSLPKKSVGTAQLKKSAVTAKKIKSGAVTGVKVKDGSLTGADLAAGSVGGAQIDESSLNVPVKPGSILLTGYDFQPRESSYVYTTVGSGGISTTTGSASFAAPIEVPPGAAVTGIKVFFLDNGAENVDAYVGRFVPSTGAYTYSGVSASSGASASVRSVDLAPLPVIEGSVQNITVFIPTGFSYVLYGARVDYR